MKKILTMITALCYTASLMAVLPVSAEEATESVDTYIVIAMNQQENPDMYVLSNTHGYTYKLPASSVAEFSDGAYFTVGDILEFKNLWYETTCLEGTNSMSIEQNTESKEKGSVTKTGSLYENAEISNFKLHIEETEYQNDYSLKDEAGTIYSYWLDWGIDTYWQPNMYPYDSLKNGNTYSFYTYEGQPLLIVSEGKETTPPDCAEPAEHMESYVVIAMDNSENPKTYVISDTQGNTYWLSAEKAASFADGAYFKVGDILEFHNTMSVVTCIWGTNSMGIEADYAAGGDTFIAQTGSVFDFDHTEIAKFELNHAVDEPETHYILSDGTERHYFFLDWGTDTYWQPNKYPYESLKDGNTYSFYTYQGQPMLLVSEGEEVPAFNPEKDNFFIALGTKGNCCMLDDYYYSGESGEYFYHGGLTKAKGDFAYGDVLVCDGECIIALTYPGQLDTSAAKLRKVGTYADFFTNKNLTVTEIETHQDDKIFKLTDSEGNEYDYEQDYAHANYAVSMENAQVGDTYTFAFNGNYLLLPVAESEVTVTPVPTVTATGDADGSGELDILDIITVNKAILGKEALSEDKISSVDFNGNGIPDADDALTMLKMLVGLI